MGCCSQLDHSSPPFRAWVDELAARAAVTPMRAAMQQAMSRSVSAKIHAAITQAVAVTVEILDRATRVAAIDGRLKALPGAFNEIAFISCTCLAL